MAEPDESAGQDRLLREKRWLRVVLGGLFVVPVALYVLFGIVLGDFYTFAGETMTPTYPIGCRVWGSRWGSADRGQVVLMKTRLVDRDGQARESFRRIVAVGGDTVSSENNRLVVNGEVVDEPYLAPGTETEIAAPVEVPPGRVFGLSDNRARSFDSRLDGPFPEDSIIAYVHVSLAC